MNQIDDLGREKLYGNMLNEIQNLMVIWKRKKWSKDKKPIIDKTIRVLTTKALKLAIATVNFSLMNETYKELT
jgi:hypothetical protein